MQKLTNKKQTGALRALNPLMNLEQGRLKKKISKQKQLQQLKEIIFP